MSKQTAIAKWKPEHQFEGTDLLPCVAKEGEQLAPGEEVVGDDNVEMDDLVLPVLNMLHGTSDAVERSVEGATPGKFHMSVTDAPMPSSTRRCVCCSSTTAKGVPCSRKTLTLGMLNWTRRRASAGTV
jgi:hypothetical protein